jgi:hypothetical protein
MTFPCTGFGAMLFVAYQSSNANLTRVTGFSIVAPASTTNNTYLIWVMGNGIAKFRIDHIACTPVNPATITTQRCVTDYSDDAGASYHSGLVDHINCTVGTGGGVCFNSETTLQAGARMFTQTLALGTNKATYYEDNLCTCPGNNAVNASDGCADMYDAAAYVFRYNKTILGAVGNHGVDSSQYSQFHVEQYRNTYINPNVTAPPSVTDPWRGNSQIMFDETASGNFTVGSNVRVYRSDNSWVTYQPDGVQTQFTVPFAYTGTGFVAVMEEVIATGVRTKKLWSTSFALSCVSSNCSAGQTLTANVAPPATVTWTVFYNSSGKPSYPCGLQTPYDGNLGTVGQGNLGYPCFGQVGWKITPPIGCASEATCGVANGTQVVYNPTYAWGNTLNGVLFTYGKGSLQNPQSYVHINAATSPSMIDLYTDGTGVNCDAIPCTVTAPPADCTAGGACNVGIGRGTTLPTTCVAGTSYNGGVGGVGFWKTNEGNWNNGSDTAWGQVFDGQQGVLYYCDAPDHFAIKYIPYTYPHPLQGFVTADTIAPAPPTGVKVF